MAKKTEMAEVTGKSLQLERRRVADLIVYENNPRIIEDAVPLVAESIRQCGYITPIVIDEDGVILAGHTRLKALKVLGVEKVRVLIYEGLTDEQKRKFRYLDNKTGEAAIWDLEKLEEELEGLDLGDLDFFNMTVGEYTVKVQNDFSGAIEYDPSEFEEEGFRYECPECGFRFN